MEKPNFTYLRNKAREYREEYASEEDKRKAVENQIFKDQERLERIRKSKSSIEEKYNHIRDVLRDEENEDVGPIDPDSHR